MNNNDKISEQDMLIFQQSNNWTDRLMYTRFSLWTSLIAFNIIVLSFFSFFGIKYIDSKLFIYLIFSSSIISTTALIWNFITLKTIYLGLSKFFYNAYDKAKNSDFYEKQKSKMEDANDKNAGIECRELISFIFIIIEIVFVIIFIATAHINA